MQISLKHGFTFLCTPKCASNSIEDMLRPHIDIDLQGSPQVRHTNVRDYRRLLVPYLDAVAPGTAIETVALVREPVSWLYSWYRFRARSDLRARKHVNSTSHVTFTQFIEAYLDDPQPEFARVGTQAAFLTDEHGDLGIDRLYAFENIAGLVEWLARRVDAKLSLRAINVSPAKVYKSNLLETVGALKRRIRGRLGRDSGAAQRGGTDPRAGLDAALLAALEASLTRDRALHAAALHPDRAGRAAETRGADEPSPVSDGTPFTDQ